MPYRFSFADMLQRTIDSNAQRKQVEQRQKEFQQELDMRKESLGLEKEQFQWQKDRYAEEMIDPAMANAFLGTATTAPQSMSRKDSLYQMANRLGIDPEGFLKVMNFESGGFNPQAVNKASGASGLIQFTPSTAESLGTTVEALRNMTFEQQLPFVEKYLSQYAGQIKTPEDVAAAVFYPKYMGKGYDAALPSHVRAQNPGINTMGDYYRKALGTPVNESALAVTTGYPTTTAQQDFTFTKPISPQKMNTLLSLVNTKDERLQREYERQRQSRMDELSAQLTGRQMRNSDLEYTRELEAYNTEIGRKQHVANLNKLMQKGDIGAINDYIFGGEDAEWRMTNPTTAKMLGPVIEEKLGKLRNKYAKDSKWKDVEQVLNGVFEESNQPVSADPTGIMGLLPNNAWFIDLAGKAFINPNYSIEAVQNAKAASRKQEAAKLIQSDPDLKAYSDLYMMKRMLDTNPYSLQTKLNTVMQSLNMMQGGGAMMMPPTE